MSFFIILLGIALIYFGFRKKVGNGKKLGELTGGELMRTGVSGYLKMMMIAAGVMLIFLGGLFTLLF